jgi:hypothetical protein
MQGLSAAPFAVAPRVAPPGRRIRARRADRHPVAVRLQRWLWPGAAAAASAPRGLLEHCLLRRVAH